MEAPKTNQPVPCPHCGEDLDIQTLLNERTYKHARLFQEWELSQITPQGNPEEHGRARR